MKKYIFFLAILSFEPIFCMQQVGASQASQALAAISPQVTQAMRQISTRPDKPIYGTKHIAANQASIDRFTRNELQKKYPHIHIPQIYTFTAPELVLPQDILPQDFYIKRILAPERLYKLPRGAALKIGAYTRLKDPIIMFDPAKFENKEQLELILLHELGHADRNLRFLLAIHTRLGIQISFIIGVFFKVIALKYGVLGYVLAPRLFWTLYMRFFEEPYADDFAIQNAADKNILKAGRAWFEKEYIPRPTNILLDPHHPTIQSRINKIQRAIDGHPNYNLMMRIAILFTITEEAIRFLYNYSRDEASLQDGLKKLEDIENNFEQYCDKLEIPAEGRPVYKYALEMTKSYVLTKLYLIKLGRTATDIKEEEIIEIISKPNETIIEEKIIPEKQGLVNFSQVKAPTFIMP